MCKEIYSNVYNKRKIMYFLLYLVLSSSTYLFTAGVEGFVISFDHTQTHTTVGRLLWTRDRPGAETST
jgi:hypothetical protein